ncbi:MAG: hypothetical protein EOP34_09130, partial [Rickettsiales bacterium]
MYTKIKNAKSLFIEPNIPGIPGIPGMPGIPGKDGSKIINGGGIPNKTFGKIDDVYIDSLTGDFYTKNPFGWIIKGSLKGTKGDNGSKITIDSGQPADSYGNNFDMYIDNQTTNYYHKINNLWVLEGTLNNESTSITAGYGIPENSTGSYGNFYLDRNTGVFYYKDYNTNNNSNQKVEGIESEFLETKWVSTGTLNGSNVQLGLIDPVNSQGSTNDFYINTSTGSYFTKYSDGWHPLGMFQVDNSTTSDNSYTLTHSDTYTNKNDTTKRLDIQVNGFPNTTTTLESTQTSNITLILPDSNDTLVGKNTTDIFSNKSFSTYVNITDPTESTSTTSGALVVGGGVGISKNLHVGGDIYGVGSLHVA